MTGGFIVLIGIVSMVMVHEAGHFFAAKAFGMKATEFFFGFGPKLWSTQKGETEYGVKAIPLGGYVRIIGMNPYEEVALEDEGRTYRERPFWQKSIVVLAGVASHFIVAFILFFIVLTIVGVGATSMAVGTIVDEIDGNPTPAAAAGLVVGDEVLALNGVEYDDWFDFRADLRSRPGERVEITINRDGTVLTLPVTLTSAEDEAGGRIGQLGVSPAIVTERVNPLTGLWRAGGGIGDAVVVSTQGMWQLFTSLGDIVGAVVTGDTSGIDDARPASPIGLVRIGAETEQFGLGFTLELVALINVFVGLFNVIPMYPLDGGHFSVALYEKIRGREADVRKLAPLAAAVVIFMVLLGVLAIYLDIADPIRLN